jgi:type I site-specific restriction endonuclease
MDSDCFCLPNFYIGGMDNRQIFEQTLEAKLREWQEKSAALESQIDKVADQQQIEFYRQLDLLEAKIDLVQQRRSQLQTASDLAREAIKANIDGISNEIENAIDSAWSKLS